MNLEIKQIMEALEDTESMRDIQLSHDFKFDFKIQLKRQAKGIRLRRDKDEQ